MDFTEWMGLFSLLLLYATVSYTAPGEGDETRIHSNIQSVPIGENATLICSNENTSGVFSLLWRINDVLVDPDTPGDAMKVQNFTQTGFIMHYPVVGDMYIFMNMTVQVNLWTNNTHIQCAGRQVDSLVEIFRVTIFVLGAPLPPQPILEVFNTTALQLSWLTPFTWPDHEIQNYTIRVENATEDMIYSRTITTVPNKTESVFLFDNIAQTCENLTFTVTATSDLGESGPATVSGRLLVAPGAFTSEIAILESGGTPVIGIQFEPPHMCPLQEFDYTILIWYVNSTETFMIGPLNASYSEGLAVNETADVDLAENAVYSVTVKITTQVGSPSFSTNEITLFSTHTIPGTTEVTNGTERKSSTTDSLVMKIGIGLGGAIITLLLLGAFTVTVVLFTRTLRRRKDRMTKKAAEKACSSMVQNPIYDGPVYEMIQPQFSSLPSSCTVATNELRYLDNPIQPSIANGSVKQQDCFPEDTNGDTSMRHKDSHSEENYIVMSPVSVRVLGYLLPDDSG